MIVYMCLQIFLFISFTYVHSSRVLCVMFIFPG